jgi:hypothetical protein
MSYSCDFKIENSVLTKYIGSSVEVIIPDGVTVIDSFAFYQLTEIQTIVIPDGVMRIEDEVFDGCIGLTHITIPNSVKYIGSGAFFNCNKLEKILFRGTHAEWVAIQKDEEWRDANGRYTIEYAPKKPLVDVVEQTAEADLDNRSLVMSATAEPRTVSKAALKAKPKVALKTKLKSALKTITYRIKDGVLVKYYGLSSSAVIPDGVKRIGDEAFCFCKRLRKITIPSSVTSIGRNAFYECSRLTDVTIPNSVTSIGDYAFSDCTQLKEIIIPGSVTSIGDSVFASCKNLTTVTISHGVRSIGICAFLSCGMTEITIPNSVTTIGEYALGTSSLKKIYFQGTPEQWNAIDKHPHWYSIVRSLMLDSNGHYYLGDRVSIEYVPQSNDSLKISTSS